MVEPFKLRSASRKVLMCRVITIPLKLINPSDKPVTLKRNTKVADVYPCIAKEDVYENKPELPIRSSVQQSTAESDQSNTLTDRR